MREKRDIELAMGEEPVTHSNRHFEEEQPSLSQHLVCKPHHQNITGINPAIVVHSCVKLLLNRV